MADPMQSPERTPSTMASLPTEETEKQKIDRMGRERPPGFTSGWSEIGFVVAVALSQILTEYFVSGFNILLPTLIIDLNIPGASSVWPATSFSLVIASTLLFFGRLGDRYGGYAVYTAGLVGSPSGLSSLASARTG